METSTLRNWIWSLALFTSALVLFLSLWRGLTPLMIVLRSILAFILIYGLSELFLKLFERTSIQTDQPDQSVGALLDIAVGQDEENVSMPVDSSERSPGTAPLAGQVSGGLAQGIPDAEKQAEIVRRMGWGE